MNTVIVSQRMMQSLVTRPEFFAVLPEFGILRVMNHNNKTNTTNCRTCVRRREDQQIFKTFMGIVANLPPIRLSVFKQFAGVDSIQLQGLNRQNGKFEVSIK